MRWSLAQARCCWDEASTGNAAPLWCRAGGLLGENSSNAEFSWSLAGLASCMLWYSFTYFLANR